jgi:hypothetical protein
VRIKLWRLWVAFMTLFTANRRVMFGLKPQGELKWAA